MKAPPAELKIKVLKVIAQEYNLGWDSSSTEAELSKKHEDLLVKYTFNFMISSSFYYKSSPEIIMT